MQVQIGQVCKPAGVLVTLEPLPFANAEGPLRLLTTAHSPANQTEAAAHQASAQVPAGARTHSPSKQTAAPGDSHYLSTAPYA